MILLECFSDSLNAMRVWLCWVNISPWLKRAGGAGARLFSRLCWPGALSPRPVLYDNVKIPLRPQALAPALSRMRAQRRLSSSTVLICCESNPEPFIISVSLSPYLSIEWLIACGKRPHRTRERNDRFSLPPPDYCVRMITAGKYWIRDIQSRYFKRADIPCILKLCRNFTNWQLSGPLTLKNYLPW